MGTRNLPLTTSNALGEDFRGLFIADRYAFIAFCAYCREHLRCGAPQLAETLSSQPSPQPSSPEPTAR